MARKRPAPPPVPYAPTRKGRAAAAAAAAKRKPPAGPYRSQSSVPSIRRKATPQEHGRPPRRSRSRSRGYRALAAPKLSTAPLKAAAKTAERKRRAEAAAIATLRRGGAKIPPNPETAYLQSRLAGAKPDPRLSKKTPPPKVERFDGPYKAQSSIPSIRAKATGGEFGVVKRRLSAYAKASQGFTQHLAEHENLGEPEDLTNLITVGIPLGFGAAQIVRGVATLGVKEVGAQLADQAAGKAEATFAKAAGIAKTPASGVRAARNIGRTVTRRARIPKPAKAPAQFSANVPGTAALKAGGGQALPVVQGHERALVEHPKTTLETTARAVPGFVTVPVGMAVQLGVSAGRAASEGLHAANVPGFKGYSAREVLEPVGEMGQEQLDFAKQVARVVTAKDSKFVQREVEENLGLMLPIMLGLGTKGVAEKITRGRVQASVRRMAETVRRHAGREHGDFRGEPPRVFEVSGQRKAEAVRTANARGRIQREVGDRAQEVRSQAGRARGSEVVRRGAVGKKRLGIKRRGDLKIHTGDLVGFAVRHALPLDNPELAYAEVKRIRSKLKDLPEGVTTPQGSLSTRDVLTFIERNPKVLADPRLGRAVDAYKAQAKDARETPGISPEHSERARFTSTAVTRDIPLTQERFPRSVRGETRAAPTRGRAAKDVLRREAKSDRSRARKLRSKAKTREARARVMRRELAVRSGGRESIVRGEVPRSVDLRIRQLKERAKFLRGELTVRERNPQTASGELRRTVARRRQELLDVEANIRGLEAEVPAHVEGDRMARAAEAARRSDARAQTHATIADRAARMDAQARTYREGADKAEAMAKRKHEAASEIDPAVEGEFVGDVRHTLAKEGMAEPEYVHTGRAREAPTFGATGAKLTQFPGKSKFRKGSAEEFGLVQEGLTPTLRESIARPVSRRESYKAIKAMLDGNEFRVGGKREWTSNEARQLFEDGVINRDRYVLVPRQLYKRAYSPDEWAAHLKTALDADPAMALKAGRHFKIVRRSAAEEFFDQMGTELVSKHLARMNRATSYLILATSPAWALSQVIAEAGQGAWAQPKILNPRFARKAIREYKALPAHKRQAFDSWVGVTHRSLDKPGDISLGSASGDEAIGDAFGVFQRTPLGRFVKSIPQSIRSLDEWKGGRIRVLTTAAKMDSELNGFLHGTRGLYGELGKAARDLRGKPLRDQMAYVAEHPDFAKRYQTYLDDVMGNWSALTKNERVASQVVIFYPFLRMSLRWMLYSFPKNHPFRHALGVYLGQANAVHLKELLGGDPSYFTQWAQFPLHTGGGKKGTKLLNLSRIAPGSNALIEALGDPQEGAPLGTAALRVMQPAAIAALTAATGLNPLTGKQEAHSLAQAATQVASLSPIARAANEATLGKDQKRKDGQLPIVGSTERQEALDKLFAKLNEYGQPARYARSLAVPAVPRKVGYERDLIHLRNLLGTMAENSSTKRQEIEVEWAKSHQGHAGVNKKLSKMEQLYSEAGNELDGLFRRYKIPFKKEEARFLDRYSQIRYGAKPGGSGETSFGGAKIGGGGVKETDSGSSASTFGGKAAKGVNKSAVPKERFYHAKEKASTFGGVPAK